jgi:hypothetical protein
MARGHEWQFRQDVKAARHSVMAALPIGWAVDREHAAVMLSQQWTSAKSYHMARHFLIVGLVASGWSPAEVAIALNMREDEVTPEHDRSIWYPVDAVELEAMGPAERAVWDQRNRPVEQWKR